MNTTINRWYVRWFLWNCQVLDRFNELRRYKRTARYATGTNLCHFFQTLFWGSVVALCAVVAFIVVPVTIIGLPIYYVGPTQVLLSLGMVIGIVLIVLAIMAGAFYAVEAAPRAASWVGKQIVGTNESPTFVGLFAHYIAAVKKKFCPTIQFGKEENRD